MGDFNPVAGIFWMTMLSYCISFYFFLKALLLNAEAWRKKEAWNPKSLGSTLRGFGFQALALLGLHVLATEVPKTIDAG